MADALVLFPHQLFEEQVDAGPVGAGVFVLIEHDLMFRQYRFHRQKLVLHRASMEAFAQRLDAVHGGNAHQRVLQAALSQLAQPDTLPSARVLQAMADAGGDHVALMSTLSAQAQAALLAEPLSAELAEALTAEALASLAEQARIEAADTMPFEQYRQAYLSPERLGLGRKPPAGC